MYMIKGTLYMVKGGCAIKGGCNKYCVWQW